MNTKIKIFNLSKIFLDKKIGNKIQVLKKINFDVKAGEFACIIGPSGCGKTTLLRIVAGLENPTTGKIFVNNLLLTEEYLPNNLTTSSGNYLRENTEKKIPEDEYLVFGDNRNQSRDGREFGPISKSVIVGKAWFRYWPPNRLGIIKRINY